MRLGATKKPSTARHAQQGLRPQAGLHNLALES